MTNKKNQIRLADLTAKRVLTTEEVCVYTGWSRSYLFKLTSSRAIPFSKPNGKRIYFDREEVEAYLLGAKVKTTAEVEAEATKLGRA